MPRRRLYAPALRGSHPRAAFYSADVPIGEGIGGGDTAATGSRLRTKLLLEDLAGDLRVGFPLR